MTILLWAIAAFLSGSIPFSVLIGRLALRTDIRTYGDNNPGATNVLRAGGWQWGLLALILDISKGAAPVGLASVFGGVTGWQLTLVALMPILGHAFSPFLGFNGGKALATTYGILIGALHYEGIIAPIPLLVLWYLFIAVDGWAVMLAMLSLLTYFIATDKAGWVLGLWLGIALIFAWKQRADLAQRPTLRTWLRNLIRL